MLPIVHMPYYSNKRSFRRYKKRKVSRPPKPMRYRVADIAYKGYQMANRLRKLINVEYKSFGAGASVVVSDTATLTNLNSIAQGDDVSGREGRSILIKSYQLRGLVAINASAANSAIRIIIFRDTDSQGATPASTDLLNSDDVWAVRNLITDQGRFIVMHDKTYVLDQNGSGMKMVNFFSNQNFHCKYDGTASTDYSTNAIWMLAISTEATNTVSFDYISRIKYVDN